jgi:exopolysaccharide biosynthesis WecB/TagA/CpsF family protein
MNTTINWPLKYNLLNVKISATDYNSARDTIIKAATEHISACVDHMPVHGIITANTEKLFGNAISNFDMVCPDGQPVRWGLNLLYHLKLADRVYGPDLMLQLCKAASEKGISIYLYGSTEQVLNKLVKSLQIKFPSLIIAGFESPPFSKLSNDEDIAVAKRINDSGAGILFIGLGCPKQELWASEHRDKLHCVQMCVGAAFDFHAGTKKQAPSWMQKSGLEWLFRFEQEPLRLWKRYVITNSLFIIKFCWQYFFTIIKNNRYQYSFAFVTDIFILFILLIIW